MLMSLLKALGRLSVKKKKTIKKSADWVERAQLSDETTGFKTFPQL